MKIMSILILAVLLVVYSCSPSELQLPNIVFIIADDIGWQDMGCYGNSDVYTPNINRLASEGLKFNNVFLTASSCSPSRTSIISGRYPHNTGSAELHTPLPAHLTVFPEELRKAGYYTAASGKWHMGDAAMRGFDSLTITDFGPGGERYWLNMLRERPMDKPFFFWFASIDAHRDWSADTCANPHKPDKLTIPSELADLPATRQDLASYYNEIQRFDSYVGLVVEELKKQGVAENTLVIVCSDNGRPFPGAKTRVNDSGVKTPFIAWWPGGIQRPGSETDALVSMIDLAPTITALAGISPHKHYQGRSFVSVLSRPSAEFRNYIFAEHNWHDYEAYERMVRSKEFMYILNGRPEFANQGPADAVTSPSMIDLMKLRSENLLSDFQSDVFLAPRPVEELYDVLNDPEQMTNLVNDPAFMENLEEMRDVLSRWKIETSDTQPDSLTSDWYFREADEYTPAAKYGIRGEMPGYSLGADTVTAKGPF